MRRRLAMCQQCHSFHSTKSHRKCSTGRSRMLDTRKDHRGCVLVSGDKSELPGCGGLRRSSHAPIFRFFPVLLACPSPPMATESIHHIAHAQLQGTDETDHSLQRLGSRNRQKSKKVRGQKEKHYPVDRTNEQQVVYVKHKVPAYRTRSYA